MERLSAVDPLATYLAANRAHANAAFAHARRQNARVTPETFGTFVCGPLAQLVRAVAAVSPDHVPETAGGLYDVALELFVQNVLGPDTRSPAVADVWQRVLPQLARWLTVDPRGIAAGVSNVAFNLEREQAGLATRWADRLADVSGVCESPQTFLDAALVLAWRCGMAHFRGAALARWRGLPERVWLVTLGLPADGSVLNASEVERRLTDPWWSPSADSGAADDLRVVARVGGFQGIDGPFVRPPQVTCAQGTFLAFDRDGCWAVHADSFGSTMTRAGAGPPGRADLPSPTFVIDASGSVTRGTLTRAIPELRDVTSFASTEWTLAVTLRHSHRVHLVAARRGHP